MVEPDEHVLPWCEKSRSSLKVKVLRKSRCVEIERLSNDASSSGWFECLNRGVGYIRRRNQHHHFRRPRLDQIRRISRADGGVTLIEQLLG
jgi:hypothetical protein